MSTSASFSISLTDTLSMTMFWIWTFESIVLAYLIPNYIRPWVHEASQIVTNAAENLTRSIIDVDKPVLDLDSFSGTDYLYASVLVARKFPHLVESILVLSYRSPVPNYTFGDDYTDPLLNNTEDSSSSIVVSSGDGNIEDEEHEYGGNNNFTQIEEPIVKNKFPGDIKLLKDKEDYKPVNRSKRSLGFKVMWFCKAFCDLFRPSTVILFFGSQGYKMQQVVCETLAPNLAGLLYFFASTLYDATGKLNNNALIGLTILAFILLYPFLRWLWILNHESNFLREEENRIHMEDERLSSIFTTDIVLTNLAPPEETEEEKILKAKLNQAKARDDNKMSALERMKATKNNDPAHQKAMREKQREIDKHKKRNMLLARSGKMNPDVIDSADTEDQEPHAFEIHDENEYDENGQVIEKHSHHQQQHVSSPQPVSNTRKSDKAGRRTMRDIEDDSTDSSEDARRERRRRRKKEKERERRKRSKEKSKRSKRHDDDDDDDENAATTTDDGRSSSRRIYTDSENESDFNKSPAADPAAAATSSLKASADGYAQYSSDEDGNQRKGGEEGYGSDSSKSKHELDIPIRLRPTGASSKRKVLNKRSTKDILQDFLPPPQEGDEDEAEEEKPEPFDVVVPQRRHLTHEATSAGFQRTAQQHLEAGDDLDEDLQIYLQGMSMKHS
jgi:hypothetical protein